MKRFLSLLLVIVMMFSITACSNNPKVEDEDISKNVVEDEVDNDESKVDEDSHYPVAIKTFDYSRNHLEMSFDKAPETVVTYGLNSVENMIALGLEDKIVVAMSTNLPERILPKYKKGFDKIPTLSDEILSKEEMITLQPDLILAWYSTFDDKRLGDVPFWNERGTKTYMAYNSAAAQEDDSDYVTADYIEREYLDILNLGKIFNVEEKAEAIVAEMKAKVEKGKEYAKISDPKKVVVIEDEKGVFRVYGEDTIGGQIVSELGGNLVAKTRKEKKSVEELIELNPDIIFSVHFGSGSSSLNDENCFDFFEENQALKNIEAYKTGALIPTDLTMVYSPGVRLLESFDFFTKNLYPDLSN